MFEGFARGRRGKNRWRAPMVISGAVVHAALFTGMWAKGLWEIKKVEAADDPLSLSVSAQIPSVGEQRAPSKAPPAPRPQVVVKVPTQPTNLPVTPVEPVPTGGGNEDSPPGVIDDPDAIPGGGIGPGIPEVVPTLNLPIDPPKPPAPPKDANVRSDVLEQRRISGDKHILPDGETAMQMSRASQNEARGVVKLCLGSDGAVRSASMIKSTGFDAYDAKLGREMRSWRYQPYQVDGVATPVCTVITVIYRQR